MEHITTVIISIAGPAILGVFGFLWRVNSKISILERDIKAHDLRIRNNSSQLSKHFDKAFTIRKNVE
jgi:hypothetical protein|tara:strand:- start:3635 stop:3835 length:201 start_codon:yes stop_codon:yes gene_type:complete